MYNFNGLIVNNRLVASTAFKYGRGWKLRENPWGWLWHKTGLFHPKHFGAFITTTLTYQAIKDSKKPWDTIRVYPEKILNKKAWQNCSMAKFISRELPQLPFKLKNKCIVSVGTTTDIYDLILIIDMLGYCYSNILGIEVNLSCHNVNLSFLENKNTLNKLFKQIKQICPYPLSVKLAYESDYLTIASIAQEQGINLIHAINTTRGFHPKLGVCAKSSYKNKTKALQVIRQLRSSGITIPIIGGSGIWNCKDIQDYQKAGANLFSMSHQFIYLPFWPAIVARKTK